MAISGVYAVIFAPMTPVAVFGVMFWGLGLLPLSPLLSLIAGLRALAALRRLRRAAGLPAHRAILGGLAAGVGLLIALNVPATLTRVMLVRAASDDPAVSRSGDRVAAPPRPARSDAARRLEPRARRASTWSAPAWTCSRRSRTTRRGRSTTA